MQESASNTLELPRVIQFRKCGARTAVQSISINWGTNLLADGRVLEAVDAHAMALFLFAQLYIRQSQMQFTMDVWPASPGDASASTTSPRAATGEGASPVRKVPHNNSGEMENGLLQNLIGGKYSGLQGG